MRFESGRLRRYLPVWAATLLLSACGLSDDPSFTEKRSVRTLNLTVEGTGIEGEQGDIDDSGLEDPDQADVDQVFDALDDGGSQDDGISGDDSKGSADPSTSGDPTGDPDGTHDPGSGPTYGDPGSETLGDADPDGENADALPEGGDENTSLPPGGEGDLGAPPPDDDAPPADESDSNPGETDEALTPTKGELKACSQLTGRAANKIVIAGNRNHVVLSPSSVVAIKVAGNQNEVELNLNGSEGATLAGLCLFVTGNRGKATVRVGLRLQRFIYVGRGNQSSTTMEVSGAGAINYLAADLAGNQASLEISGEGSYPCQTVRQRGNRSQFICN